MKYSKILITGGAGFVGSNLAIKFKQEFTNVQVFVLDNLKRRGSELNISRLAENGIDFIHGDIRNVEDLEINNIDLLIECSAEPSVLAGINSSPNYLINTNLLGSINCFELARRNSADVVFISTSRVYPMKVINKLNFEESEDRFDFSDHQICEGISKNGISENFSLLGTRSLYGATKLASELILQEYLENYNLKGIINRSGVLTGPWQFGKVDQGVIALWIACHIYQKPLSYIGFDGQGKQVRDFLHIDDLYDLLKIQLKDIDKYNGQIFNVGGGLENSLSLKQLTSLCEQVTGNKIEIKSIVETRPADIKCYISDITKIKQITTNWQPKKNAFETISDIAKWIQDNQSTLQKIF